MLYGHLKREIREKTCKQPGAMAKDQVTMLKLFQKQEEELQRLSGKNHRKEVKLLKRQKLEAMEKVMSGSIVDDGSGQRNTTGDADLIEAREKIGKLEENLAGTEEKFESQNVTFNALLAKERKANEELEEARSIGLKALKYLEENENIIEDAFKKGRLQKFARRPQIGIKMVGAIDEAPWENAFTEDGIDEVTGAMMLSSWIERIRDPEFRPFKKEKCDSGDAEWKQVVDDEEQHLSALRNELGEDVYQTVVVALQEIEQYNSSGRYPVPRAWNFDQAKPADVKDVIEHISLVTEALVRRVSPTRKNTKKSAFSYRSTVSYKSTINSAHK